MPTPVKCFFPVLLALLAASQPLPTREANRNVRFGMPSPAKADPEQRESYCRGLVQKGHELHIVCGPHGVGGTGRNGHREEIGTGRLKVTVPAKVWKVILVLPNEDAEPRRNTRVISIIMPNNQTVD